MICGGIDIGGTKIEARLFSADLTTVDVRRISTPKETAADFVDGLAEQVRWLEERAELGPALPVGIALPGLIDQRTGHAFTSNLPISGHPIEALVAEKLGRHLPIMNDCQAFALSEANGGAGEGFDTVVGLILGTGVGAGLTYRGRLTARPNGSALEVGHIGVPARTLVPRGLPLLSCGCGKTGCFEQYVSGTGLSQLGEIRLGHRLVAEEIVAGAKAGESAPRTVLDEWAAIAAELLLSIQLDHDPDCIVIGGGLSGIADVAAMLEAALRSIRLGDMRPPAIRVAIHGGSSGARGAAILARQDISP